jgi:hypothetical protein
MIYVQFFLPLVETGLLHIMQGDHAYFFEKVAMKARFPLIINKNLIVVENWNPHGLHLAARVLWNVPSPVQHHLRDSYVR